MNEICEYTDAEQAELIADNFSNISNDYIELKESDIKLPPFPKDSIPHITQGLGTVRILYNRISLVFHNKFSSKCRASLMLILSLFAIG